MSARRARCVTVLLASAAVAATVATGLSRGLTFAGPGLLVVLLVWLLAVALLPGALHRAVTARQAYAFTLVLAFGLQVFAVVAGPQLSDDLYRYVWDARVSAAGIDPYAHAPSSAALEQLRTPDLWPGPAGCLTMRDELPRLHAFDPFAGRNSTEPGCTRINRPTVRTIYPPAAQLAFRADAALTPDALHVERQAEVPAAVYSLALTVLLLETLRRTRRRVSLAALYAASPLAVVEAGMDAHIDVLAGLLGVACVLVLAQRRQAAVTVAAAGVLLGLAFLTKLYPAALGVLLFARFGFRDWRAWFGGAVVGAVSALLYLPHVLSVGGEVVGYLPGYLRENGYGSGGRYFLVGVVTPGWATSPVVALLLVALVLWAVLSRVGPGREVFVRATWVLGLALLLLTPGDAWYCTLLLGCAVLAERPEWLAVVAANYVAYFTALQNDALVYSEIAYVAAGLVVLAAVVRRVTETQPPPLLVT